MDLSMQRPVESFPYRHKKFDAYKRPRDEDAELEVRERRTPNFVFNPLFYGAERVSTPFSTDSNCSTEYAGFVSLFNASSTPTSKKRCLLAGTPNMSSPSEDSGIALTIPIEKALKRTLKQSALAQPLAKRVRASAEQRDMIPSSNIIVDMALKRRKLESIKNPNPAGVSAVQKRNDIKAALKPALKPTPAGTLELTTASTMTEVLPPAAANVLSRISEDKLRSICTYHGNMVRQFPKKQRSPKEQERRNKNTIACRMSRRLKKLEHIAVEVQLKEYERQYAQLMEQRLRMQIYMEQLMQLCTSVRGKREMLEEEAEIDVVSVCDDDVRGAARESGAWSMALGAPPATVLPVITSAYSIAFLTGSLRK